MEFLPMSLILCSTFLATILFVFLAKSKIFERRKNLPPGSLGFPLIGHTLEFLSAYRSNTPKEWIEQKVSKYGDVFKTSLMGCPTVIINGQAGNRFLLNNDSNLIASKRVTSSSRIVGKYNITQLNGEDHKRMRSAMMQFLKPEALQRFVGRMNSIIKHHFVECWEGKDCITMLPLVKTITFQLTSDLLFGLNDSEEIEILGHDFTEAFKALWSLPLDLPGTAFRSGLKARSRICKRLSALLQKRKKGLEEGKFVPGEDLMSSMLSSRDENGKAMTEEEIIDNMIALMAAGHETTCNLLINVLRLLALHPHVYQKVLEEHMRILTEKDIDEPLAWNDIKKMKYTWKACQETMRLMSPVFGGFRKAVKDVEFGGFVIPKGWQLFWVATSTHMNENIFNEPSKFDPSHFDVSIPPYNFVAFGGGPRICPGYDFAKMETLIYLHHLICKYKWSLIDQDEKIIRDPFPFPINGLLIKIQEMDK